MKKLNTAQAELVTLCDKMENTLKLIRQRAEHYTSINSDPDLFVQSVTRITDNMLAECKATKILSALTTQPDMGIPTTEQNQEVKPNYKEIAGKLAKSIDAYTNLLTRRILAKHPVHLLEVMEALQEYNALVASGGGE